MKAASWITALRRRIEGGQIARRRGRPSSFHNPVTPVESLEARALLSAGDLDPSFGVAGRVTTSFGAASQGAAAVAIQSDGKLVVSGNLFNGVNNDFAVARYNTDGSLDTTFGSLGKFTMDLGGDDYVKDVAVQEDGKIVLVGSRTIASQDVIALIRLNPDGSFDSEFGVNGAVFTSVDFNSLAKSVGFQTDGKILVAGIYQNSAHTQTGFALVRYNADGSLDSSFGNSGVVTTDFGSFAVADSLIVQTDGKIVVAGEPRIVRYNSDGSLDNTFGTGGSVAHDLQGLDIQVQSDGKIVVAGNGQSQSHFAVNRYNQDGTADSTFGSAGSVVSNSGSVPTGLAVQEDGKAIVLGYNATNNNGDSNFVLTRYNPDGSADFGFGPNGTVVTDFGFTGDGPSDVVIQPDGRIVAAGNSANRFALARYFSTSDQPATITSPDSAGVAENTTFVLNTAASDPEGRVVAFGIVGGPDQAKFTINAFTGSLAFVSAPDFEHPTDADGDNIYQVQIAVSDGTKLVQQSIEVTVTDTNEAPVITSANSASISENTTTVMTIAGSDPENEALTYSLAGGADDLLFSLNPTTGALDFLAGPNFESPQDTNHNNVYEVRVSVSDGTNSVTQPVTVTVTNVDESPTITSASAASIPENTSLVFNVTGSDPEGHSPLYGIIGGADQAKFTLNFLTGSLSFVSPPDFEHPTDANHDNVYVVQVAVSDGTHLVTQDISVTVTNVNETMTIPLPVNGGNFKTLFLNGQLHLRSSLGKQLLSPVTLPSGTDVIFNGSSVSDRLTLDRSWSNFTGNLTLNGNGGNDQLDARTVSLGVTFNGGDGNDTFLGGRGDDTTNGGMGLDSLSGNDGNDSLTGGDGNDKLFGGADGDILAGDAGTDSLSGGDDDDSLSGGEANDTLAGDAGNDTVMGDAGADSVTGGDDDDLLFGGTGNDSIDGGRGEDVIDGGDDNDNLKGSDDNDSIRGGMGNDTLSGGNGDDLLTGSAGNDSLLGDAGIDTLLGDDGLDKLNGGLGTDIVNGISTGPSKDTISDSTKVIDTSFAFDFDDLLADLL